VHEVHGPEKGTRWIHVSVPTEIETVYLHKFSQDYLRAELRSWSSLRRCIAEDLLLLSKPIRRKVPGCRYSFGGRTIECTSYVVDQ